MWCPARENVILTVTTQVLRHKPLSLSGLLISLSCRLCFVSVMDKKALGIWIWKEWREPIVPRQYGFRVWRARGFPYESIPPQEITLPPGEIGPSLHNVMGNKYKHTFTHMQTQTHTISWGCTRAHKHAHTFSQLCSPLQGQTVLSETVFFLIFCKLQSLLFSFVLSFFIFRYTGIDLELWYTPRHSLFKKKFSKEIQSDRDTSSKWQDMTNLFHSVQHKNKIFFQTKTRTPKQPEIQSTSAHIDKICKDPPTKGV